jgi:hypothetical protein
MMPLDAERLWNDYSPHASRFSLLWASLIEELGNVMGSP